MPKISVIVEKDKKSFLLKDLLVQAQLRQKTARSFLYMQGLLQKKDKERQIKILLNGEPMYAG